MDNNIKCGYPNPNYGPEDIEMNAQICLDDDRYYELVSKAAALDILVAHINATGKIDSDVVFAVTGTTGISIKNEADKYSDWWHDEHTKCEKLAAKVAELEHARNELIEILRQNKIGPYAEQEDAEEQKEES